MRKFNAAPLALAFLGSVVFAKGAQPISAPTAAKPAAVAAPAQNYYFPTTSAAAAAPTASTNGTSVVPATAAPAGALGAMDPATQEALQKTQQGLTNPAARAEMMKGDAKAQAQDAKVKAMLGDQSEGAYQLSSQLLETLVMKTNGDPAKMQEIVNQLMANPQMLEQYLTTQQRDQIRQMASEIEGKKGSTPVSGSR